MGTYKIVAELSNKDGYRTLLLRNDSGDLKVCKEIHKENVEVFQKLFENPHPNIVSIDGIHKVDEDKYEVFMEYFSADTLEECLTQVGTFSLPMTKKIMLQCCVGVNHLHDAGMVHRDLKPSNILINTDGMVKIIDFGISRFCKKGKRVDTKILGTAGYAAPEQFGFLQTDKRTDVYALGVLMNQMLTGSIPSEEMYHGEYKIRNLIEKCISISPTERCELVEIERALGGHSIKQPLRKKILRRVPGFRSGNKVHKILAVVEYIYTLLVFFVYVTVAISNQKINLILLILGLFISTIGFGYFIGSFSQTAYRHNISRGIRKMLLFFLYGMLGSVLWLFGIVLMTIGTVL